MNASANGNSEYPSNELMASSIKSMYADIIKKFQEIIPVKDSTYKAKSSSLASTFRNKGNIAYSHKENNKALLLYTRSVAMAVPESEELALAFANRSAVLLRLEKYNLCLLDINRALNGNYSKRLITKLLSRKTICIKKIEEQNSIKSNSNPRNFIIDSIIQRTVVDEFCTEPKEIFSPLPKIQNTNKFLPNASSKIEICYSEKWGRHLIATQKILPGEIIAVEKFFTSALKRDYWFSNCSFCFVKNEALIPCPGCSVVMYCGEHCRLEASVLYHRTECEFSQFLDKNIFDIFDVLVLRTFLVGTKQGKHLEKYRKNENFQNLFGEKPQYSSSEKYKSDYLSIYNLHINLKNYPQLTIRIYRSAIMLHLLKQSSFFNDVYLEIDESSNLMKCESFTAVLLLNHYLVLQCNSFGCEERIYYVGDKKTTVENIGAGLTSFLSLVNHSCDPNVYVSVNKNNNFMFSKRPINSGEQIFTSYIAPYYEAPLMKRQFILNTFGFSCQCNACKFDWPLYQLLPLGDREYLFDDIELNKQRENLRKHCLYPILMLVDLRANIDDFVESLSYIKAKEYQEFLCILLTMLHKTLSKPSKIIVECEKLHSILMLYKFGNCYVHA